MRAKAIFISPLLGYFFVISVVAMFDSSIKHNYTDALLIGYFIALLAQGVVEIILLFLKNWLEIDLETYLGLACIICFSIWVYCCYTLNYGYQTVPNIWSESFEVFIFFFGYSIINALTYNYLYFSKIEE